MNITQTSRGIILQKLDLKSSFYIIKNCVFKGNRRALDLDGNNNIISENIFENPEYSGIWMISDYSIITNNTFINYNSKYLKDHIRLDYSDGITICDNNFINLAGNHGVAINLAFRNDNNVISNNKITGYAKGIVISERSKDNEIFSNHISNNDLGIDIYFHSHFNKILSNNFIGNERSASFHFTFLNQWSRNYWDIPRFLPKPIFGTIGFPLNEIQWINFDWRPAKEPYDIGV